MALSPDGQGLSSTDQSQSYVTARRSGPVSKTQPVIEENCCQEEYGCETKKIEAEFNQKLAACHHPGNAACNSEAVNTKASKLQAANAKLRQCNRTVSDARSSSRPTAGEAVPPFPASNDVFHSTEGAGGSCQRCMPSQGTDQASGDGGDIFGSDSPGSEQGAPPSRDPGDTYGSDSPGSDGPQTTAAV